MPAAAISVAPEHLDRDRVVAAAISRRARRGRSGWRRSRAGSAARGRGWPPRRRPRRRAPRSAAPSAPSPAITTRSSSRRLRVVLVAAAEAVEAVGRRGSCPRRAPRRPPRRSPGVGQRPGDRGRLEAAGLLDGERRRDPQRARRRTPRACRARRRAAARASSGRSTASFLKPVLTSPAPGASANSARAAPRRRTAPSTQQVGVESASGAVSGSTFMSAASGTVTSIPALRPAETHSQGESPHAADRDPRHRPHPVREDGRRARLAGRHRARRRGDRGRARALGGRARAGRAGRLRPGAAGRPGPDPLAPGADQGRDPEGGPLGDDQQGLRLGHALDRARRPGDPRRRRRRRRHRRHGVDEQRPLPAARRPLRLPDGRRQGDRRDDPRRAHQPVHRASR